MLEWPTTASNVSSGYRTSLRPSHAGVDIDGGLDDEGNPVYAAACGVISLMQGTSESGGYGNFVCVKHTDRFVTCYAHLSRFSDVSTGDYVRRGEVIGAVGNTGHSFGAHLHFETRRGTPYRDPDYSDFDPLPYLNGLPIPGDPVAPPSGGVGGPSLGEPEAEPSRSTLAHRPRATSQAPTVGLGAERAADGSEAIDALKGDVGRQERAAASPTVQPRTEGESPVRSEHLGPEDHFPTVNGASSVSEMSSSRAIPGAADGGNSGVSGQDEGFTANRPEGGGSHHVGWGASNRDEGNASPQDGSGASPPGQDGPDSGVGDAHAAPLPDVHASVAETSDRWPLEEALDDQSTGTEAESAPSDDARNGGAQVIPDTGHSPGTTGAAAGEHPGGAPAATDNGVVDRSENRPTDPSASRPGNGSQGADGTMEESSGAESLESDREARRWANHSGTRAGSARAGFTGDEPASPTSENDRGRVADTEPAGASHANDGLEADDPHGEPRVPDEDWPAGERSRRDPGDAEA